jgi:tRNA dimethylallyltransferase
MTLAGTRALFLMGPTASGKSAIAITLADHLPVEIINVDSASVYRGMDIGTAKPDAATLARYPHHLLDCADPTEAFSAARFRAMARTVMHEIARRGHVPLLVGGTMLYFKALLEGLDELPEADAAIREAIDREALQRGWPALHAELAHVDPATAARLKPGDAQRIQRALEVYRATGKPLAHYHASGSRQPFEGQVLSMGLMPSNRSVLHQRIAQRFDAMLAAGLEDELTALRRRYALNPNLPAMRSVGYRQMWEYLEGAIDRTTLRDKGIAATRQLAKRQLTWLRQWPGLMAFDCLDPDVARQILEAATAFLQAPVP